MKDIIKTLTKNKYKVTIVAGDVDPVAFYLGVVFDDFTDLWYLSQLCHADELDVGVALFKENIVYFPRLPIDKETYGLIVGEQQ